MAKYTVTHACGHEETVQLYGPTKERDRKLAWLAEQDCPECRRAAKVAEAKAKGLTQGTDKQIAYAADILAKVRTDLNEAIRAAMKGMTKETAAKAAALGSAEATKRLAAALKEAEAAAWTRPAHAIIETHCYDLAASIEADAAKRFIASL